MDAFRALTGGVRFDKKRFNQDLQPFESKKRPVASTSALPAELDFFNTTPAADDGAEEGELSRAEAKKSRKRKRAAEAKAAAETAEVDYAALMRQHRIKLTGLEPPNPIPNLDALPEGSDVLKTNWRKMGMNDPTAVQLASWGVMLADRDLLACAPTGSGKTLSFILPLLLLNSPQPATETTTVPRPTSLVLEPTRELVMQVWRETNKLAEGGGWSVKVLGDDAGKKKKDKKKRKAKKAKALEGEKKEGEGEEGGADEEEVATEDEAVEAPAEAEVNGVQLEAPTNVGPTDVLITTPLRLIYAIKNGTVDVSQVRHLVLDEADKLFELNFVEQTDEIIAACKNDNLRKAMFSATMPSSVETMAQSVMSPSHIRAIVGHKDSATATIDQSLHFVGLEDHKLLSLRTIIREGGFTPPVLIFVQSILRAKELATELLFDGINADCIHAERSAEERDEVVRNFAEGKVWCLISTDVMGRGVDFKGVKLVINYDFPQSSGSYIHRIGRTGRAGKPGRAITFFTKADAPHLKSAVNVMRASGCEVPQWMLDMKNPTQDEKKALRMKPIARKDISRTNGAGMGDASDRKRVKRERVLGGKVAEKGKKAKERKAEKREVGLDE